MIFDPSFQTGEKSNRNQRPKNSRDNRLSPGLGLDWPWSLGEPKTSATIFEVPSEVTFCLVDAGQGKG